MLMCECEEKTNLTLDYKTLAHVVSNYTFQDFVV
jgi:hypothetical protein